MFFLEQFQYHLFLLVYIVFHSLIYMYSYLYCIIDNMSFLTDYFCKLGFEKRKNKKKKDFFAYLSFSRL